MIVDKNKFTSIKHLLSCFLLLLIATVMAFSPITLAVQDGYEEAPIRFYNPEWPECTPSGSSQSSDGNTQEAETSGKWTKVGVSVYGKWGDSGSIGSYGDRLHGTTSFAELSTPGTGTLDFKHLADYMKAPDSERESGKWRGYKHNAKFALSYTPDGQPPEEGNIIIVEKKDRGGNSGTPIIDGVPRVMDLWHETAKLIGWNTLGLTSMWVQKVPDSTPVTPVGSGTVDPPTDGSDPASGATSEGQADCVSMGEAGGTATGEVSPEGYAFPLAVNKAQAYNFSRWPCSPTCHHDRSGAVDITKGPATSSSSGIGTPVIAIHSGEITTRRDAYNGIQGCNSFQLKAKDGWVYYYTHITGVPSNGTPVEAGQQVGTVSTPACGTTVSHVHVDRGFPKGRTGGVLGARDPAFPQLIDNLYNDLP